MHRLNLPLGVRNPFSPLDLEFRLDLATRTDLSTSAAFSHPLTLPIISSILFRYSSFDPRKTSGRKTKNQWPTFCGSLILLFISTTFPGNAAPDSKPPKISIIIAIPEPFGPPIGKTTPSNAASASVVGLPPHPMHTPPESSPLSSQLYKSFPSPPHSD